MSNLLSSEEPQPTGVRWDPLGAASDGEEEQSKFVKSCKNERCQHYEQLKKLGILEKEQELLNSSLLALTTHFAQVQFRLRQVVDAPAEEKDKLLKSVEEFAFRGTPDIGLARERQDETNLVETMRLRRAQQQKLLKKLKAQLRELERHAFESGKASVPQERQHSILSEHEHEMGLNLEADERGYHQLTTADLKQLNEQVNLLKMKEHLIGQLKKQVDDLEIFINYLQAEMKHVPCICGCTLHSVNKKKPSTHENIGPIKKIFLMLEMFAMVYLSCGSSHFKKRTITLNHWEDLSAYLEVAIEKIRKTVAATRIQKNRDQDDYLRGTKLSPTVCNVKLATKIFCQ